MDDKKSKVLSFEEDTFDLESHKNAAHAQQRKKYRIKRSRRKITVGKIILALAALAISIALYYLLSVVIGVF
ncbi:MAG: hypothetical protein FWG38_12010 [Defluviitaleaceae bacterium]|nr:hypothetical protein [Defluviitaleaceae bacterium]